MRNRKQTGRIITTMSSIVLGIGMSFISSQSAMAQTTQTKQRYAIIQLGDFGGGYSQAWGINQAGAVVGSAHYPGLTYHAMRWQDGTMIDPVPEFPYDARANDINDLGQMVGHAGFDGIGVQKRAFFWAGDGYVDLGTFGGVTSEAIAINDRGQVVGEADYDMNSSFPWPFIWEQGDVMRSLLPDACEGCYGSAKGINALGFVVGFARTSEILTDGAVLWDPEGNMIDLDPGDDRISVAYDINDDGIAVGRIRHVNNQAVLWDENHNLVRLDAGNHEGSVAQAINNSGIVVGSDSTGRIHAALWDRDHNKYNLNYLVAPRNKWWITYAWDINDNNQIAGECVQDKGTPRWHAVLLTPVTARFGLTEPTPAVAGEMNEITARGGDLEPGMRVNFYWGVRGGGTMFPTHSCDILDAVLQIENAKWAGSAIADENGIATLRGNVPAIAKDEILLFQAMVPARFTSNNKCMQSSFVVTQFE